MSDSYKYYGKIKQEMMMGNAGSGKIWRRKLNNKGLSEKVEFVQRPEESEESKTC